MLHHTDYREPRQGICDAEVYDEVRVGDTIVKVRYRIHTDTSYPHQSYGRVYVWNHRSTEWNEVASFASEETNYTKARAATVEVHSTLKCLLLAILS